MNVFFTTKFDKCCFMASHIHRCWLRQPSS